MLADVEDGRVVGLRGDPGHPVTKGFLCHRTNRFLERQYSPYRITQPRYRGKSISMDAALDLAAEKLLQIRQQSGAAAILHYRSGGSLGLLKEVDDYFFEQFGPTTIKSGDICSGAGDAAQELDFGYEDMHDIHDVLNARHILNWGKNVFVSSVHMLPILKQARAAGVDVTLIDPIHTRSVTLADRYLQLRPGGDAALALAVGQRLFTRGPIRLHDNLEAFRTLCFSTPFETLLASCDLSAADVEHIADCLLDGPTVILVGWGMQRRLQGASIVRLLDALSAISGNLGRPGGGVQFSATRRRPFNLRFKRQRPAPRAFPEPLLAECIENARDPEIRMVWISCANPVTMLPESERVARALETREFTVVVDAFETDTTRRATLVLPTTTMLEDDDLVGSYGHHYLGVSRPVVSRPEGVLTDLEIMQALARRTGLEAVMAGSARDWKSRLLEGSPLRLEALESGGPVRHRATPPVLFPEGRVPTPTGRVNLITTLPPAPAADEDFPLWLCSNSTERAQCSQWADAMSGPLEATVHPDTAAMPEGSVARLVSAVGSLTVRIRFDARQRRDVVLVPKGGHLDDGRAANVLVAARTTDAGGGAAYQDTRVRLEPMQGVEHDKTCSSRANPHEI